MAANPEVMTMQPAPRAAASMSYGVAGITPSTFEEAWRLAQLFSKSDLVPRDYKEKPENCLVAMQMGAELGLKPLQALQGIAVVNGRPSIWGDALWALVQSSSLVEDAHESFDQQTWTATCAIKRKGRQTPTVQTFSKVDAEKAGLWNKTGPWQSNPRRMLQMRARAFAARDAVPDVLKGMAVYEEVIDIPAEAQPSRTADVIGAINQTIAKPALTNEPSHTIEPGVTKTIVPAAQTQAETVVVDRVDTEAICLKIADFRAAVEAAETTDEIADLMGRCAQIPGAMGLPEYTTLSDFAAGRIKALGKAAKGK